MEVNKIKNTKEIISNIVSIIIVILMLFTIGFIIFYIYNKPHGFIITETDIKLKLNEEHNILVLARDPNKHGENNYTFTSSDTTIASVDELGNVTPLKEGYVEITVRSKKGFNKETIKININGDKEDLYFINDTYAVIVNKQIDLELNSLNNTLNDITWSVSNAKVATVDDNGRITAHKEGETIVTASLESGISAQCKVLVQRNEIKAESIKLNKTKLNLGINQTQTLSAKVYPENATDKKVTWYSSDTNIVEVKNGVLKTKNYGSATITVVLSNGIKETCSVTVSEVKIESISLDKTNITLDIGATENLKISLTPAKADNKNITWKSSDETVATVNDGLITAKKEGKTTITVTTSNGKTASATITVKKLEPTGLDLNKTTLNLIVGQSSTVIATIKPTTVSPREIIWTSTDSTIATVSNGNVIGKKEGTTTITAQISGTNIKKSITVNVERIKVTAVKLNKTNGTIYLNNKIKTVQLTATVSPSNAQNKNVVWSSSNTSVATVKGGLVTAKEVGTSTITATTEDGKFKAEYKITVKKKTIIVVTASQGVRMYNYFKTYTSKNNNYYSLEDKTLKYIYKSGSGFDYQYGTGFDTAMNFIKEQYSTNKKYIELNFYFTLTGNTVKKFTCDKIQTSSEYDTIANTYNSLFQKIKDQGYNVKGFVITHSPLNTKHPLASKSNIVYSHKTEACKSGYRSAWKYHLSNERFKQVVSTNKYPNVNVLDNWSNFLQLTDEANRKFKWLQEFTTPDDDALHWDKPTTIRYMQLAFDTANM